MRVLWIQDYEKQTGGAEQSNKCVVNAGESLGFDVVGMSPQSFHPDLLCECDVAVVNNFWKFQDYQTRVILFSLYEGRVPYVIYSHDYRDITRPDFARPLFSNSALNVFISPQHRDIYRRELGVDGTVIPLCIDVSGFAPQKGVERKQGTAVVATPAKQGPDFTRYVTKVNGSVTLTSLGKPPAGVARVLGPQPFERMPAVYSQFEYLVHMPRKPWAGERIVFEAALCGCKVIANDKVGHASWGWDLEDRGFLVEQLERAPYSFWRQVECAVWGQ